MGYNAMCEEEWRAFLVSPVRAAVVATTRADGRPHAAPVWYALDGDTVVFTTGSATVKGRNLRRDPRVMVCVHDDEPPFSFVDIEGIAEITQRLDDVRSWATRIGGGRYVGASRAAEYGARNGVP